MDFPLAKNQRVVLVNFAKGFVTYWLQNQRPFYVSENIS